jgi:hypothetical protein
VGSIPPASGITLYRYPRVPCCEIILVTVRRIACAEKKHGPAKVGPLRRLIVAGAVVAFFSSILILDPQLRAQTSPTATGGRKDSSDATAAVAPKIQDKIDLSSISRAIGNEASLLKDDAVGWDERLQELEVDLDLKKRQQDFEAMAKDIDECVAVLRAATNRLSPAAEIRNTFRKQEGALREVASRAEVHSDPAIRKTAAYFQRKTTELRALNRSVEETRIKLTAQIDRLEAQLAFNAGASQMSELARGGRAILDDIQAITASAQRLANELTGVAAAESVERPQKATKTPAAITKPGG